MAQVDAHHGIDVRIIADGFRKPGSGVMSCIEDVI